MAKYEFKVGDRVQFKEWDEMEKEFGLDFGVDIKCYGRFNADMRHLCGTYATIKSFGNNSRVYLSNMTAKGDTDWFYHVDMLKPASTNKQKKDEPKKPEIVYPTITAHLIEGNKTTVMLSDGRIGEVTCYYKDTFDPAVGVAEAYKKALGTTKAEDKPIVKEVERVAKVGEYIKLNKNARNIFNNEKFCKGDIILVTDYGTLPSVKLKNGAYLGFLCEDYVVLENYTPPAENKTTDATVKEAKREAHIGEYVKVVDANLNFGYRNGDILKVILKTFNAIVADSKGEGVTLWKGEYVVLEGYDPDIHGKI